MANRKAPQENRPASETWRNLPWRKLEQHVYRIQKRIYRASQHGNGRAVQKLQKLLMKSEAARLIAVRRVTQDNQGKKTAGIDGMKSAPPAQRLVMTRQVHPKHWKRHKTQPVRRVWIPKPGKTEKRPLGIPVMLDRAQQALVKLALEPGWEARFEPNSYGFRPGRSCHDAIAAIFNSIRYKPKFVLDADIKGKPLGFKTIIKPSKEAITAHTKEVKQRIKALRSVSQGEVIKVLNPINRGWPAYYSPVVASKVFTRCDYVLFHQLIRWGNSRHPHKGSQWKRAKYWRTKENRHWVFATPEGAEIRTHSKTHIRRHIKVKGNASPYDGNLLYWAQRLKTHPMLSRTLAKLLQKQQGKCRWCELLWQYT